MTKGLFFFKKKTCICYYLLRFSFLEVKETVVWDGTEAYTYMQVRSSLQVQHLGTYILLYTYFTVMFYHLYTTLHSSIVYSQNSRFKMCSNAFSMNPTFPFRTGFKLGSCTFFRATESFSGAVEQFGGSPGNGIVQNGIDGHPGIFQQTVCWNASSFLNKCKIKSYYRCQS